MPARMSFSWSPYHPAAVSAGTMAQASSYTIVDAFWKNFRVIGCRLPVAIAPMTSAPAITSLIARWTSLLNSLSCSGARNFFGASSVFARSTCLSHIQVPLNNRGNAISHLEDSFRHSSMTAPSTHGLKTSSWSILSTALGSLAHIA